MFRHSNMFQNRLGLLGLLTSVFFCGLLYTRYPSAVILNTVGYNAMGLLHEPHIAKASMLYGPPNFIYEAALESYVQHNKLHGYKMHVLRIPFVKGFQNKLLWLQHLIMSEIQKPESERVDWIMYIDPSIILLNPQVPLRIFLPPPDSAFDSLSLIATKPDGHHLSTSSFFIRVSPTSIKILIEAMAAPKIDTGYDWGADVTSSTLSVVVGKEEHREAVVYQPAHWYNMALTKDSNIERGMLFARFPRELQGWRWKGMNDLLQSLSKSRRRFEMKVDDTIYANEPKEFWERIAEAKQVLKQAEERGKNMAVEDLEEKMQRLRDVVALSAWDTEIMKDALGTLRDAVGLE